MKKPYLLSLLFCGFLGTFIFLASASELSSVEKKECVKKCYKNMHGCLVKGSNLPKEACFSKNVGQMLMCIDSKGMGSLKRKRLCFGMQKKCKESCK